MSFPLLPQTLAQNVDRTLGKCTPSSVAAKRAKSERTLSANASAGESDFAFSELLYQGDKVAVGKAHLKSAVLFQQYTKGCTRYDLCLNTNTAELVLLTAVLNIYSSLWALELK